METCLKTKQTKMPIVDVEEILKKYKTHEERIENLINQKELEQNHHKTSENIQKQRSHLTLDEAKERNKNLLMELETVKGNLRSKAIFSPTELQWENICKRYQDEPSLVVTTWRCHLPVFV